MRDVSKKLGLSDNGLRKNCVKAFVPLPPQGYWNKLQAGHEVKIIPLPPRPPGISDTISIGQWDYRENERRLGETEPVPPVFEEPLDALRERITRNIGLVVASKNLSPPHAAFRRQVEDEERRAAQSSWHTSTFSTPMEKRRLRILQGLFYGLSRLDCSVTVQGRETRTIYIGVGNQNVSIALERAKTRGRTADDKDEDRLKFSILRGYSAADERLSWTDSTEQKLEAQLSSIAVEVIITGEMQYRETLVWHYEDSIRRREAMRQAEIKRKLEAEKAERERLLKLEADRLKRLTDSAENYRCAESIRAFVATVTGLLEVGADPIRVEKWRKWAMQQADKLDPIATGQIWNDVNDDPVSIELGAERT